MISDSSQAGNADTDPSSGKPLHRPLDEEVLQSAEEVVMDELYGMGTEDAARPALPDRRSASGMGQRASFFSEGPGVFSRLETQLNRFVAVSPAKAALLAVGAGALLALALSSRRKRGAARRYG